MAPDLKSTTPQTERPSASSVEVAGRSLSSDALARRRVLLKGLGKGSAALAALAVPMHSLAANSVIATKDKTQCKISGAQSGVHSGDTITATCTGFSTSYYSDIKKWPNYDSQGKDASNTVGAVTFGKNTKFNDVFGGLTSKSLISVVDSGTDDAHWVAALLNAIWPASKGLNYPYSPSEVIAFYNGTGQHTYDKALAFFVNYMERG